MPRAVNKGDKATLQEKGFQSGDSLPVSVWRIATGTRNTTSTRAVRTITGTTSTTASAATPDTLLRAVNKGDKAMLQEKGFQILRLVTIRVNGLNF